MLGLVRKHTRNRRRNGLNVPPPATDATVTPTVATTTVTLTYNIPVVMNDTPDFVTTGKTITAAHQTAPNVIQLTLNASGAGLAWTQGPKDPAVRTLTGGYVTPKTGTFP
jgi:hypothetical protein